MDFMKHWTQHFCLQGGAEWLNHLQVPLDHPDCAGHWKGKCWGDSVLWWWEERRQSCRWCRCVDTIYIYMYIYVLWTGHVPSVHPKWYWYVIRTCSPSHPTIYICFFVLFCPSSFFKSLSWMDNCPSSPCHLPALNQSNVLRVCWLCTVDPFYRFNHVSLWSFKRLPYVWWDWDKLSPECQVAGFFQGQTDWKTGMWYLAGGHISASTS